MTYGSQFRKLLNKDELIVLPAVHDPLTARVVNSVGFDGMYMTGYGTSVAKTGYPDAGVITMNEMVENANSIQEHIDVPLIADADTGYGNAINVIRTVREYVKTGVAGIHIEDQTTPKRCGRLAGKRVIPIEQAIGKYRAAVEVRDERNEDFVIIARTDALKAKGGSMDEAIRRANAYLDAGADIAMPTGASSEDELARLGEEVTGSLLHVGPLSDPPIGHDRLKQLGVDILIYSMVSMQATLVGMFSYMTKIRDSGSDGVAELEEAFADIPIGDKVSSPRDLIHVFSGIPQIEQWEQEYLPERNDDAVGG